ncbi:MAG: 16S rRNA (adenine(1518)-N(6)/adenine(1519)-N(6))-dimethyltransferase RsmA [Woeseiaceae bacterium]|nr:16S rRNA (adenine(1518)-N(6)/adenine(1519)-N(6))-dimethyltransferase RsmA [Woeseiaceae bacterium]
MNKHRARKRFGQHFLTDPGVIHAIVEAIRPQPSDTIVEIGPGPGAITRPLSRRAGHLHLIELDRDLVSALRQEFAGQDNVTVHEGDALSFDFRALGDDLRVVGNLPYNISTPLLFALLSQRDVIRDMHFMLQKEVVDRLAAQPGSKAYGRLGVMLSCHQYIEPLFDVPPESFDPPPAVMSAVVRLTPKPDDACVILDEDHMSRLVAAAFGQRRKTLRNSLSEFASAEELSAAGIDPGLRAEQLDVDAFVSLSNALLSKSA